MNQFHTEIYSNNYFNNNFIKFHINYFYNLGLTPNTEYNRFESTIAEILAKEYNYNPYENEDFKLYRSLFIPICNDVMGKIKKFYVDKSKPMNKKELLDYIGKSYILNI